MKMMKRIACMLLALMMILSMTFAYAESAPQTGSITINGVSEKTTYEIYKLLDLLSYNVAGGNYSYKVNADWAGFFATDDAKAYFQVDNDGYVNWIAAEDDDTVAAFAKKALAYAKSNNIAPVQSSKNEGEFVITGTSGTFSNLKLGYYLVDSTMGALCGLTTTNPNASINAKNGIPTIDKQVKEDSTNQWADANTADIGQIVEFRVTINVHAGAENYVLHDEMSAGLSFRGVTGIQHVIPEVSSQTVPAEYYTVVTTKGENGIKDDCTFEVRFTNDFTEHLETNDKVIITYDAQPQCGGYRRWQPERSLAGLRRGQPYYA